MSKNRIWLSSPHMSEEGFEKEFVSDAFDTNWIAPLGPNVDAFEKAIQRELGVRNAIAMASGTSAIHMALKVLNVGKGDKVFCQSLTFAATANPIIYLDAYPIFIDSNLESWNICPKALEKAIKENPDVKVLIVVNLYGLPAQYKEIKDICKKNKIKIIEDAAESLGSVLDNKFTGTLTDIGILSFNGNKIITTSGGGMLVTNNDNYAKKVRKWITQSREDKPYYEHKELGYNYRMSNVLAGIGRGQLKVLKRRVEKKRYIYEYYKNELGNLEGVSFMPEIEGSYSNYWLTVMIVENKKIKPKNIIYIRLNSHELFFKLNDA